MRHILTEFINNKLMIKFFKRKNKKNKAKKGQSSEQDNNLSDQQSAQQPNEKTNDELTEQPNHQHPADSEQHSLPSTQPPQDAGVMMQEVPIEPLPAQIDRPQDHQAEKSINHSEVTDTDSSTENVANNNQITGRRDALIDPNEANHSKSQLNPEQFKTAADVADATIPQSREGFNPAVTEAADVPLSERVTAQINPIQTSTDSPAEPKTNPDTTLDKKLNKTNANFGQKMKQLFSLKKKIDEDLFEDLETTLLMADVGAAATIDVLEKVRKSLKRRNLSDSDAVMEALQEHLTELAMVVEKPLVIDENKHPFVILVVGVNGVGKTTTIAKLARKYKGMGKKVMLAAGDTFRAAAVEQLKTWGEREDIPVMAQKTGADSASVIFDAMTSAKARNMDILIADTAGRLHTQANLMQELEKISRVIRKNDDTAPHETLIVIDGGTGQNAISQVREFNKANLLTGVVITKLDGTPKGGVLFNLAAEFGIPVRYIGVGEKSSDLKDYQAKEFVKAIIN